MKRILILLMLFFCFSTSITAQNFTDPWSSKQLMDTKVLADRLKQNKMKSTVVVNIGPDAIIKNSFNAGPGQDDASIKKMKTYLNKVSKDKEVVLYCGCCPFIKCPNIRPAFKTVTNLGFKNVKLLNIPQNIKVDWIDKGYPVNE